LRCAGIWAASRPGLIVLDRLLDLLGRIVDRDLYLVRAVLRVLVVVRL
jgi:hypothetical protein